MYSIPFYDSFNCGDDCDFADTSFVSPYTGIRFTTHRKTHISVNIIINVTTISIHVG
ncbi:MAG: hypothetical protein GWN00_06920 [Aliifodinibius sp.]|nr:hypothetical protein [Fodinibius sp.]NIV10950.1 hypothetical protein [Fodinibius sp.]NIY24550.1 hypothetical protein [Fodinibius sp.]